MADDILKRITWYPESYDQGSWQTVARGFLKKLMPRGGNTKRMVREAAAKAAAAKDARPTLQNCQTTGCIAGTASILAGDIPAVAVNEDDVSYGYGKLSVHSVITEDGTERDIQQRGAELLCLDSREHQWLFAGGRTVTEVVYALREISAGKRVSCKHEVEMTAKERQEIAEYRHQLRMQKPRTSYIATNKTRLTPRDAREKAKAELKAKREAKAGREVRH
jgi:hypothetical protein